jgi:N-acylglucosamine 2-epimerase
MKRDRIDELAAIYREGLLDDTLPFWLKHSIDKELGGYMFCRDRDGSLLDSDKGIWQHCRFVWLLCTLYNTAEPRQEYLDAAKHGIDFLRQHAFDADGRMFFQLARDGSPIRKRRYVYTESFGAMAFSAYAKASGDPQAVGESIRIFELMLRYLNTPGLIPAKSNRQLKNIGSPMVKILVAQTMRENVEYDSSQAIIDDAIAEIRKHFLKPDLKLVMENVGPDGEVIEDHFDGRMLHPPTAIEVAWFILHESRLRGNDPELTALGCQMLDWMWQNGWDSQYGGMLYFTDMHNKPVAEYWHDMKFWWCQCEAIIATLLAHHLTGDEKYETWHKQIHDWTYQHFPDPEHGEWYGYLHRDGRISVPLKGNIWKGPYHIPRMQLYCWQLLEEMKGK